MKLNVPEISNQYQREFFDTSHPISSLIAYGARPSAITTLNLAGIKTIGQLLANLDRIKTYPGVGEKTRWTIANALTDYSNALERNLLKAMKSSSITAKTKAKIAIASTIKVSSSNTKFKASLNNDRNVSYV